MVKRGCMLDRKGQISAYIIIALVIIVFAIVIYYFYPNLTEVFAGDTEPNTYMKTCIGPELDLAVDLLSRQGGYADPQGYVLFEDERVKYLCYTTQYFQPCYVQQPLLVPHVEKEIEDIIEAKTRSCVKDLKEYYQKRGYVVTGGTQIVVDVQIVMDSVGVVVEAPMSFTKEGTDNTDSYKTFRFGKETQLYSLLMTAVSVIDFESTYGDSETTIYMQYYPELQLRKTKLGDGSKVYTITNVRSQESFTFASRGLSWPGGLGYHA
jgi:hypothetical protein